MGLQGAMKESNRCLLCYDAPCSQACPAGTDPAKFIRQIKFLNFKGAARTIRNNNILGTVCSYICPVEKLCEKSCSIKALEDPIDISGLQQFATMYGQNNALEPLAASKKTNGKIAVIGCGPGGMSCAASLAKMDYHVIIFEREAHAGGVPKWNIPEYRLPSAALSADLKNLLDLGVEIRCQSDITGVDAILQMLADGYDAVFIGCGLARPYQLPMFNGFSNAVDYSSFLRQVKFDRESVDLKDKNVAVIGGGSVAIDAAVSAKACGAGKVYLISLENLGELPADREEINLARVMDVIFKSGSRITGTLSENSKLTGLAGTETNWIEPGIFSPSNARDVPGTEFNLRVDLVVQAIGTSPGIEISDLAAGLKTNGKGVVVVDENFATTVPGIFAGGDVVNGGATVVQAVGEGKRAAESIDHYLKGRSAR